MGRPPKKDTDKRKHRVSIHLTDTDLENLAAFETVSGIDERAKAARLLFLEGLRNHIEQQKKPGIGGKTKPS